LDILPGADILHDLTRDPIPLKDDSVEAIYCSHVLEHIWSWRLEFVLQEFHRVLKYDAPIRIVVPDMDIAVFGYVEDGWDLDECMKWWFDPSLDKEGNLCLNHVTGFNYKKLAGKLMGVGFRDVQQLEFQVRREIFCACDNPGHANTSIYVEAVK
jgi:ubiquinone/menaquinone biosynthesis C-methylase UbiE